MESWMRALGQWLYDWQTLIAGLIALVGAYWAVSGIGLQIAQADELEELRRVRAEAAAKAVLPLSLSELSKYCRECIQLVDRYIKGGAELPKVPHDLPVPRIGSEIIATL
jgi:hypothetical protein